MFNPKHVFTEQEIRQIQLFGISINNSMIPLDLKDHYMTNSGRMWDIDTYTHGVCKCLTMDHDDFLNYYQSKRHDDSTMCSNLPLFFKLVHDYKVPSFQKLKTVCHFADRILVVEAGRGIDVLLASMVKKWQSIEAYDLDKSVLVEMKRYFAGDLGLPFKGLQISTFLYNFGSINEKTIIFGTCHNLTEEIKRQILENKNLIAILDGEIIK